MKKQIIDFLLNKKISCLEEFQEYYLDELNCGENYIEILLWTHKGFIVQHPVDMTSLRYCFYTSLNFEEFEKLWNRHKNLKCFI